MTLTLGLFGAGVMGQRHIKGLAKLRNIGQQAFRIVGICDLIPESANKAADLAEELLGNRPVIYPNFASMHRENRLDAITLTTMPNTHVALGIEAFSAGVHVLCEKPVATTVKSSWELVHAGRAAGRKLAIAENYRRDPMNRLGKALLDAGVIGHPYLMVQSSSGSGEQVIITPWRHLKKFCGIAVDMGVHYTDILEYYLGAVSSVVGLTDIIDVVRIGSNGSKHPVDAEDLVAGSLRFASGAVGHFLLNCAGRGEGHFTRAIYGTGGSLILPPDRSGQPVQLVQRRSGADVRVANDDVLSLVPRFSLDETTAALFGGRRLVKYDLPWVDIDANLLAIEYADFASAISQDHEPEVNGEMGLRSLALMYGFLESQRSGAMLSATDLVSGAVSKYQDEL